MARFPYQQAATPAVSNAQCIRCGIATAMLQMALLGLAGASFTVI
jgi:hypothetical protein